MDTTVQTMQARRAEARENADAFRANVARYRIDGRWLESGKYQAILTVSLPDSHVFRFTSEVDPHDIARLTMAMRPEVGNFLGDIWKGVKKITKKVATSKVFKAAATALAAAAPALGPLAPAAMGAATAMKMTTALVAARSHAAAGNTDAASQLVDYANKAAKLGAAINVKAAARGLPTSLKAAAGSLKLSPAGKAKKPLAKPAAKPAAKPTGKVIPLEAAMRDHAQQASARIYTMMLRPA
jgi:hypothetical protein